MSTELIASPAHQLARIEIDSAIATAKQYPRDVPAVLNMVEALATRDDEVAESCYYVLPGRKKKDGGKTEPIMGPSIRLMEIFQSQWGNLRTGARVINVDPIRKMVTVQAAAHDLQSNSRIEEEVTRPYFGGDDGIKSALGAAQSIGIRNVLKRTIGPFVDQVYEKCRKCVEQSGDPREQFAKALAWFKEQGATEQQILDFLGLDKPENAQRTQVAKLRGLATAIKEGYTNVEIMFSENYEPVQTATTPTDPAKKANADAARGLIAEYGSKVPGGLTLADFEKQIGGDVATTDPTKVRDGINTIRARCILISEMVSEYMWAPQGRAMELSTEDLEALYADLKAGA